MRNNAIFYDPLENFGAEEARHAGAWTAVLGGALLILGVICTWLAVAATFASVVVFGAFLFAAGLFQTGHAFAFHGERRFLHLLGGIFYLVTGALMLWRPLAGAVSLTLLLAAMFLVGGVFRAMGSVIERYQGWGWGFASGVLSLLLGVLLLLQWPLGSLWVIGFFVGLEMAFVGIDLLGVSLVARRMATLSPRPDAPRTDRGGDRSRPVGL